MSEKRIIALLNLGLFLLTSCSSFQQKGKEILEKVDQVSKKDKELLHKTGEVLRSSFQDLTDEEEYYIGRSVSALILSRYKVWDNQTATNYLNLLAQAVSLYSDRPEIFGGYHVLVLDSEEINALSAPGGFIFLTRGLLQLCPNEDALAGIMAHEIGHISARHGLMAIKKSRLLEAFKLLASEAAEQLAPDKMVQLTDIFEGALDDIIIQLIERGYDRKAEYEADSLALKTLRRMGYSSQGLILFMEELIKKEEEINRKKEKVATFQGWMSTHPAPQERWKRLKTEISSWKEQMEIFEGRTARFKKIASTWK